MEQNQEEKRVYRAELHLHTPSSSCYKGPKTDDEYLKIVEAAHNSKIDILAVTDHNSINGYKKITELHQKIANEYTALASINDSKEAKAKAKQLYQTLMAFETILLIPGVEFEVNNGIHLLVLFNPDTPLSTIEQFLSDGGYDEKTRGKENDAFSIWSVFDLYKESKKYDCIVIDAHSDSSKGIYNTLEGQPRIHAFADSSLLGICYKSEKQRVNIENIITQYDRKVPVAFLKSSDAHQISEIGRDVSFFRLNEKSWNSFRESFSNPAECVFTTYPQTHSILKKVASSGSCLFINQLDNIDLFLKYVCGLSNSNGGFIIIGAESIKVINGLPKDSIETVKSNLKGLNDKIPGLSGISISAYPIKDKSLVFVIKIMHSEDLLSIINDDHIYYFQDNKIVTLNASKVQSLITQRLTTHFLEKINTELDSIRKRTTAIDTFIQSLPILSSFYNSSIFLSSVVSDIEPVAPVHLSMQQLAGLKNSYQKHGNGLSRGGLLYFDGIQRPRLNDAYLRISPPRFYLKGISSTKDCPLLYLIPGGAVFYSEKVLNCYYNTMEPVLKLQIKKNYPIKFLCAYLKSTFFLWYVLNKYYTFDIIPPSTYNNIRIPQLHLNNSKELAIITEVESHFDQIIDAEKIFLIKQNSIKDPDEIVNEIIRHNESVRSYFIGIDNCVYSLLNINETEKLVIRDNLRVNNIFVPE